MQRIQQLRATLGLTPAKFAEALKVPEALVVLWEKGEAEPDITALRDIATLLGTSVDEVMDFDSIGRKMSCPTWLPQEHSMFDGMWGYLGLLLPGQTDCRWYPITLSEYSGIKDNLANEVDEPQWLVVNTLNNRKLLINPERVQRIRLVDDAAGRPDDDAWDLGWDTEACMVPEIYRALDEYFRDSFSFENLNSPATQELVEKVIEKFQLTEDHANELTACTHVYLEGGTRSAVKAGNTDIYNLVLDAYSAMPVGISLSTEDTEEENHFSPSRVALVEIPLLQYQQAEKEASLEVVGA